MKRFYIPFLLVAAAAVAACNVKVDIEEPADGSYIYTLNASAPDVETKTDYDSEGTFSWSAGDAISVLFHNGETNKFFTLTTTGSGANVTFSGTIDSGYTVGASDGTSEDLKIWALFPASDNHEYTPGSNPNFYVQPSVDFTTSHFSANIPMYALNAAEGAMSFLNLASTYKFVVKNIKSGVDKVTFRIHNQTTFGLSGSWPIHADLYLKYDYASPGSANSTLTYTSAVTDNQAVFYVSCRYWGEFQPVITVTNATTGVDIKTFTATKVLQPNYKNRIWPVTLDVIDGNYYTPAVTIDGSFGDWDGVTEYDGTRSGGGSNSRISAWRVTSDTYNVYVYLKLFTEKVTNARYAYVGFDTNNDATGDPHGGIYGAEQYVTVYPAVASSDPVEFIQGTDPRSTVNGSSDGTLTTWGVYGTGGDAAYTFIEMCIPRSKVTLGSAGTVRVAVSYNDYETMYQSLTLE